MDRNIWAPYALAFALAPFPLLAQTPVGEVFAGDASVRGSIVLAAGGVSVLSGSQVSAGESAATFKLQRGGELRICPRTSISVNASPEGNELMIGVSTGALELHYMLATGTDTVMTPDFRIQMIGPGWFHLALAADPNGRTCIRPLAGSSAGVIVSEMMGSGRYQVAPDSAVSFAEGKVSSAKKGAFSDCGCPAPKTPPQRASATDSTPAPAPPAAVEPKLPPETHLQVDTPMVYQGDASGPSYSTSRMTTSRDDQAALAPKIAPPPDPAPPAIPPASSPPNQAAAGKPAEKKHGFFRRVGHFFASFWGGNVEAPPAEGIATGN